MIKQIEAVYENGVLRPLEPLALDEHQRVTVTLTESSADPLHSRLDLDYLETVKKEVAARDPAPTLEEVRAATSKDHSSWSDLIIAGREDRF